ncbi:cobalt-precorrin-6A reductase [Sulfitobacter mediterraneus]|uniref:cobalt-precorrin-6A reductase n=1 Tax=Sulfitobacter mediterraneus TaxID=83219 RepID=UPI001933A211|nr:cobalt-precorrin-6A reductase [Sulfitobacter mediterraneus]MBM1308817.1 cobalt-precorrin-6A reductase [Sulfitobacter mediterraneus]MBM1312702.1 cobalt-precorrin-6A reductase [Sulfitobacter mediterraneus]MBM1321084.1 cobalt-precorrin-6A reductase [Sulfitobacter mediterraneus]MBM1324971.1 cobalt-precorrin-6A reductase [Sulfitobacter mediterraneus]MBM1396318.1 cobalt-precorrin-6A reductase [Sulfitobacter mediterraneus]
MMRVLLLGGTSEASQMAKALSQAAVNSVFSYAGRTNAPVPQPLPTRIGGFGGVAGLAAYLRREAITHVIDATHPFAAGMSRNAYAACTETSTPLIRLERPAWQAQAEDDWTFVATLEDTVAALPDEPARVFLAIGKQHIDLFATKPQHHYLLRLVDAPEGDLPLPYTAVVIARGPFDVAQDLALLQDHEITHIVAKNAGGRGAEAKLNAARQLGLPVILADRPALPGQNIAADIGAVMAWLGHDQVALRGV